MTLDLDGAVPAGVPDAKTMLASGPTDACGPALHYGDPSAEYRALDGGRAFVDLSDWDVVRVSGPDRLGWLNSLTSQRMIGLRAGDSTETLLLGPSGHVENAAFAVEDGEATWLVTDPGHGAGWVDFLDSMRFTMRVEVAIREDLAAIGGLGRHAADGLVRSAIDRGAQPSDAWREIAYAETVPLIWTDPWPGPAAGGATYTPPGLAHPAEGWGRFVVLVERRDLNEAVARLADAGYTPAGALAWEAARLAAWRPQAKDVEAKSLPHEFDWLRTAVHLDKGCYRGQETVAKLVNLGRPPRRLVELYLEGSLDALPAPGTAVEVDGRLHGVLSETLSDLESTGARTTLVKDDFVSWALRAEERFDLVIQNPPYHKIRSRSLLDQDLRAAGIIVPNIYAGFMALGSLLMDDGGQQVSITPRSWMNGTYFSMFRRALLARLGIDSIHTFQSRSRVFGDLDVLQETIVVAATRGHAPPMVRLSSSVDHRDAPVTRAVPRSQVVTDDFIFVPASDEDGAAVSWTERAQHTLSDLGLSVSTGRVVDFRCRDLLADEASRHCAPMVYPANIADA